MSGITPDGSQVRCGFGDTDYPRAFVTSDATKVIFGATRGHRSCALFRTDTYLRDRVHHRTVRLAPRLGPSVPLGITNGGRFVVLAADIGPRGAYHRLYLLDRRHGLTDLTLLLPPHRHRFWDRVYLSRNAAAIAIGVGDRTFVYHRSTGSMDLAASANLVVPRGISMDGRFMAVIDRDPGLLRAFGQGRSVPARHGYAGHGSGRCAGHGTVSGGCLALPRRHVGGRQHHCLLLDPPGRQLPDPGVGQDRPTGRVVDRPCTSARRGPASAPGRAAERYAVNPPSIGSATPVT